MLNSIYVYRLEAQREDSDGEDVVYLWGHSALKRWLLCTAAVLHDALNVKMQGFSFTDLISLNCEHTTEKQKSYLGSYGPSGVCACDSLMDTNWVRVMRKQCSEVVGTVCACVIFPGPLWPLSAPLAMKVSKRWRTRGVQRHHWWDTHTHAHTHATLPASLIRYTTSTS